MFYDFVRAVVGFALRMFYRLRLQVGPVPTEGPVIFVGNHPNGLIDPALVFIVTPRRVTFLAKAPLFKTPIIGSVLRGLDALPVYRKQDDPTQMSKNEGTFESASSALVHGGAITLFPEGKSHSEPQLAEIKTGAARIAFRAAKQGARLRIVPVGLTYKEKSRFRSEVLIETGEIIDVAAFLPTTETEEAESVRGLTQAISDGLRKVTLNLEKWEDLPVIETAEAVYAFGLGEQAKNPDRLRRFAKGMALLREEQPARFAALRAEVAAFRRRLGLVRADPSDLSVVYQRAAVWSFAGRNLLALALGLPLFAVGIILFAIPFYVVRWLTDMVATEYDDEATIKFIASLLVAPLWVALLTFLAWHFLGARAGLGALFGTLPFGIFTRYFYEGRLSAIRDVLIFFTLGSRTRLKAMLLVEGERLSHEFERLAAELRPRLS